MLKTTAVIRPIGRGARAGRAGTSSKGADRMRRHVLRSLGRAVAVLGLAGLTALPAAGQSPASPADWTPPRTAWGDPDLQGNFTNVFEQATPLERPDDLAGRRLEDVTGPELATILQNRRDTSVARFDSSEVHAPTFWWADSLAVEHGSQAWFVVDPPDGRVPPLTDAAEARIAARAAARRNSGRGPADSYEDRSLYDRCITRGLPSSMMPTLYGNSYQIVQTPGYVAIRYEMVHETRVIPLTDRPALHPDIRQHMGDARGHWEGDTLVVESSNFRGDSVFRNANPDTLRLTERFRRTAPNKVQWTVTVEDANTWTQPWTFTLPLTVNDQESIFEYACHEGNYGLRNILSAARAEDREGVAPTPGSQGDEFGNER
jgi:hypothetical protein